MRISDWSSDVCSSDLRHGEDVVIERARRRAPGTATASIYLRSEGRDTLIATRPNNDITTFFERNFVRWTSDAVLFNVTDVDPEGRSRVVTMAWSFAAKTARVLDTLAESANAIGPLGGHISSEGYGERRELVEDRTGGARKS